jgi:glycosyltransferase involved in cell wall biosynthesis
MRVVHLPFNVASQIGITVGALRRLGVEARGLIATDKKIYSSEGLEDLSRLRSDTPRFSPRWMYDRVSGISHLFRALHGADVIHYHYGLKAALLRERDLRWVGTLRRLKLITFWGSDIRVPEIEARDNPYYARVWRDPAVYTPRESAERSREIQEFYASRGFHCVVGSENMVAYVDRNIFPTFHVVRCAIRLEEFLPSYPDPDRRRPLLVHSPSDPGVKGTAAVLAAIDALQRRGLEFEFQLVQNMARAEALTVLRSADIFLDQFVLGAHGMAAIEAMAFGKTVVGYIRPTIPYLPELPIVTATQDNLADVLEPLIVDGARRHEIGVRSRRYAEQYHDAPVIAKQLVGLYQDLRG